MATKPTDPVAQEKAPEKVKSFRAAHGRLIHPNTLTEFSVRHLQPHAQDPWISLQVAAGKLVAE